MCCASKVVPALLEWNTVLLRVKITEVTFKQIIGILLQAIGKYDGHTDKENMHNSEHQKNYSYVVAIK